MKKSTCLQVLAVLFAAALLLGGTAGGLAWIYTNTQARLGQLRERFAPPVVLVDEPETGDSLPTGALVVAASIHDFNPMNRAELWLDGARIDQKTPGNEQANGAWYIRFVANIPTQSSPGAHNLVVRAIDRSGVVGESLPIYVTVQPASKEEVWAVPVQAGDTLESIAGRLGVRVEEIRQANPGVPDVPPAGTTLDVPHPIQPPGPAEPAGGQNPPAPGEEQPLALVVPPVEMLKKIVAPQGGINIFQIQDNAVPDPPSDLKASLDNCEVTLVWNDNSLNEQGYYAYYHAYGVGDTLVGGFSSSNSKGPAWVRFPAQVTGKQTFWVEAFNEIGKSRSNEVDLDVPKECPGKLWYLQLEAVSFTTTAVSQYYCYVSLQGMPAFRVPAKEDTFIQVSDGKGKIADFAAGQNKLVVPQPASGGLKSSIKCMGWSGGSLVNLGYRQQEFPPAAWDNKDQTIALDQATLVVHIMPLWDDGPMPHLGYGFTDPTLPAPFDLTQEQRGSPNSYDGWEQYQWEWERLLKWKWNGDPAKISGFRIFLNGKPYKNLPLKGHSEVVTLPVTCGQQVFWQVAAYGPGTESQHSAPLSEMLPNCSDTVMVGLYFAAFHLLGPTSDTLGTRYPGPDSCDTLSSYTYLYLGNQHRWLWGAHKVPVSCNQDFSIRDFGGDYYSQVYANSNGADHLYMLLDVPVSSEVGNISPAKIEIPFGALLYQYKDEDSSVATRFDSIIAASSVDELLKKYPPVTHLWDSSICKKVGPIDTPNALNTYWNYCVQLFKPPFPRVCAPKNGRCAFDQ
jgi:LysM repeat protein